jgi:TRAP-type C4-dicarboxylate transport system substrate-binding protein
MKSIKKVATLLAAVFILTAMATGALAAQTTLRFAGQFPPDHTATGFMKEVAKEVAAKSNGRIEIKIFPANQLGDYTLVYEELIRGTIDMALISVPSQFDPRMELVYINGFVKSYDDIKKAFKPNGWIATKMDEFHTHLGVKFLGFNVEGMIGLGSTKPVREPLNPSVNKGVLTRVPFMEVYKTGVEAMGYKTISLPYADIYQSMQTGVCDAVSSIPPALAYTVLKDVMKHWYQLNYSLENESYLMSQKTWSKLKPADQKIIFDAVTKVAAKSIDQAKKDDIHYMDLMRKKGIKVYTYTDKQLAPLQAAIAKSWVKLEPSMGKDLMDEFRKQFAPKGK